MYLFFVIVSREERRKAVGGVVKLGYYLVYSCLTKGEFGLSRLFNKYRTFEANLNTDISMKYYPYTVPLTLVGLG